jgi:hypothetical protein
MRKLGLQDIEDLRAYERHRKEVMSRIIELKRRRRVAVGPVISVVFENEDTVKFQIQEMARAERMISDDQIRTELDIYNTLLPEDGWLSATVFIELPTREELYQWLPRLVGIERCAYIRVGGDTEVFVRGVPEASHEETLTREDVTASVHYVQFPVGTGLADRVRDGPVYLGFDHPEYKHEVELGDDTKKELAADLS